MMQVTSIPTYIGEFVYAGFSSWYRTKLQNREVTMNNKTNENNTNEMHDEHMQTNENVKVKSLVKALQLLECFSADHPQLGISELSAMLGYNKATVYNIASTFTATGYLKQDPVTSKYSLGLKLLQFSYLINKENDLPTTMVPYLQKIADATGETVYLGIPYEADVLYLATRTPSASIPRTILGEKAPMYCTGLGKCLLAFTPEEHRPSLPETFKPYTSNTITTRPKLLQELAQIKERGYAIDNMEHEFGVSCVAVPIFGNSGEPIAAVSVSGPSLRFDFNSIEHIYESAKSILEEVQYLY